MAQKIQTVLHSREIILITSTTSIGFGRFSAPHCAPPWSGKVLLACFQPPIMKVVQIDRRPVSSSQVLQSQAVCSPPPLPPVCTEPVVTGFEVLPTECLVKPRGSRQIPLLLLSMFCRSGRSRLVVARTLSLIVLW